MRWYFLWQGISCWLITKIFFFWIFWRWKIWYFWAKILMEIWYLLITEKFLFWSFWWWEIRPFFESTRWWKDDIYLLPRSSCFELFGDGKYGLFSAKKLMERWYLLGLFELSIIFQGLANTVFRAVMANEDLAELIESTAINHLIANLEENIRKEVNILQITGKQSYERLLELINRKYNESFFIFDGLILLLYS